MIPIEIAALIRYYTEQSLSVDRLPYSPELGVITVRMRVRFPAWSPERAYYTLLALRKAGGLPTRRKRSKEVAQ